MSDETAASSSMTSGPALSTDPPQLSGAFEDSLEERDYQESYKVLLDPPKMQQKSILLLGTLGVFVAIAMMRGSSTVFDIVLLVGVLLVHELGHALTMRAVGYTDVRIFFIPFLGAAAGGRRRGVARWKQAVVLLMGPMPGIVLGLALALTEPSGMLHTLALLLIAINVLNLLPIEPLDGGQLFGVLLYSRNRHLEIIVRAITAALIVAFSIMKGEWIFVIIGVFMLIGIGPRKRILAEAETLRPLELPSDPALLDDAQRRTLWRSIWSLIPADLHARWRGNHRVQANSMEQILDAATTRAPSPGATSGLLLTWFAGIAFAVVALFLVVPARWQPYTHPSAGFTVLMPGGVTEIEGENRFVTAKHWSAEYGVTWSTIDDAETWLEGTRTLLVEANQLVRDIKAPANERRFDLRDGDVVRSIRLVAHGKVGYAVIAQPGETDDAKRVLDSFKP